jgi:hypothetical protein
MTFLYTMRGAFDRHYDGDGISWEKYLEWSRLTHLTELISLDGMLTELLVEPNHDDADDWNHIVTDELYETGFFTTLEYVMRRSKKREKFNLLAVVIKPDEDCKLIQVDGDEFMGYDLLDKDYGISALTNCGGFDEVFLPSDLNRFGLVDNFSLAYDIKNRLYETKPEEYHADTNIIAVWRHQIKGR